MSKKYYLVFLIPLLFFIFVTHSFFGQYPSLDPMLNYRDAAQLNATGFRDLTLTANGRVIHPPLLNVFISTGFSLFGKSPFSYNLIGFLLFSLTLFIFIKYSFKSFNPWVSVVSTILIFCNPMIIVNFFYPSYEVFTIFGLILFLYFNSTNQIVFLALSLGLFPLMKETALAIPILFFFWLVLKNGKKFQKTTKSLLVSLPFFIVWISWKIYAKIHNFSEWREAASYFPHQGSSFQIVIDNILKLNLFNQYFWSNAFNLFIFNFQWVYLVISLICFVFVLFQENFRQKLSHHQSLLPLGFVSIGYGLLVFGFPTWTIVRYPLPLYPFVFLFLSFFLYYLRPLWLRNVFLSLAILTTLISNFSSIDPITHYLFPGKKISYGVSLYNPTFLPYGWDSLNYNQNFLQAVKNQNTAIKKIVDSGKEIVVTNCVELKMGEKLWTMFITRDFSPQLAPNSIIKCFNTWEIEKYKKEIIPLKTLFLE